MKKSPAVRKTSDLFLNAGKDILKRQLTRLLKEVIDGAIDRVASKYPDSNLNVMRTFNIHLPEHRTILSNEIILSLGSELEDIMRMLK